MKKKTDELVSEIKATNDIERYICENTGEFNDRMFLRTLQAHYAKSGLTQETIANRSMLSHGYVNNVLNNAKRPSRDTVIKLSFGLILTVDEANRLLKFSGHGEFYPRLERDAVLMYCLNKNISIFDAVELLEKRSQTSFDSQ